MTGSRCFKFSVTLHIETNGNARYSMTAVCCLFPLGRRKHDIYTNGCVTHIIPLLLCLESHLQHSFLPSWMPYVSSWPATFLVITLVGGNQPFCLAVKKYKMLITDSRQHLLLTALTLLLYVLPLWAQDRNDQRDWPPARWCNIKPIGQCYLAPSYWWGNIILKLKAKNLFAPRQW